MSAVREKKEKRKLGVKRKLENGITTRTMWVFVFASRGGGGEHRCGSDVAAVETGKEVEGEVEEEEEIASSPPHTTRSE